MKSKFEVGEEVIAKGRIVRIIADAENVDYCVEFVADDHQPLAKDSAYIPEELLERDYGDDD